MRDPPILPVLQISNIPFNNEADLSFYQNIDSFKGFGNENHESIVKASKKKYFKPSSAEIDEIIRGIIPENTHKATIKWFTILENWHTDVGYNYSIETIEDKEQLECEMIEFIIGICQVRTQKEYVPSSLVNCINLLSLYEFSWVYVQYDDKNSLESNNKLAASFKLENFPLEKFT
ncbi:264_t:CDS:2, partial [Cetraspora pellucida]